jgi:predicted TIM-barrel fold metal-dependent hydrolase
MRTTPLFDADNHYYEPRDVFSRHFEPKLRDKMIRIETAPDGTEVISAKDRRFNFLDDMHFNFSTAPRPGSLREFLKSIKDENVTDSTVWEAIRKEAVDRHARIDFMDAHGIDGCFLFPTLGVCLEPLLKDDPEALQANYRAFNRWLDDDWGFARDGRIYSPPMFSLTDLSAAVTELDWALKRGARMIGMLPGPVQMRSPADPMFDEFWRRADEAHITLVLHIGESGYNQMFSTYWGENPWPSAHKQSALQWTLFYGDRPIMDTIAALIYHNFFGRYPNIKVLSVENGCQWVPYLLNAMDKMKGMGRNGPWPGGPIKGKPSEIFKQHIYVNPYHEEDHALLAKQIGVGHVVFGSDYPHAEGMEQPREFINDLGNHMGRAELQMIVHDNARNLVEGDRGH